MLDTALKISNTKLNRNPFEKESLLSYNICYN